ncbi:type II toxin-antitoxin system RelE/ParE family toxin [Candidatus Pacearchaeota archaeon]|nr:type II toxin-antitoxin system RelE/ParE family toxin [Candidatus Pacearchaeota archaeon]
MYSIIIPNKVERQLKNLDKSIQERIISVLERIKIRPQDFVEKLVGEPGFKLRVGDYRIILDIIESNLIILLIEIGHRKNIYKH